MTHSEAELREVDVRRLWAVMVAVFDLRGGLADPPPASDAEPGGVVLDVWAWLCWVEAGLTLFSIPDPGAPAAGAERAQATQGPAPVDLAVPPLRQVVQAAQRVALVLTMARQRGNVTHAANALQVSRRALREHLRTMGLYPWGAVRGHEASGDGGHGQGLGEGDEDDDGA
ncbi:MAG: hypothetical protein KDK70_16065 [Myxococcales bacterium]|nr:hypothetical protein [Myxococcales bacterium]